MSRSCSHRPSRILANREHFNEKLFVDLCDWVDKRGNRNEWLVAVDRHTDFTVIAPCPSHESRGATEKWRTERFCNIQWRVSVVGDEIVHALNQRAGGCESSSNTSAWSANEGLWHEAGKRDQLARRFVTQASAREVLERHVASEVIRRIDIWCPRL